MQDTVQSVRTSAQDIAWTGLERYDDREALNDMSEYSPIQTARLLTCRGWANPCLIVNVRMSTAAA